MCSESDGFAAVTRSHAGILFVQLALSTGVNSDTAQILTSPQGGWGPYRGGGGGAGRGGRGECIKASGTCDREGSFERACVRACEAHVRGHVRLM